MIQIVKGFRAAVVLRKEVSGASYKERFGSFFRFNHVTCDSLVHGRGQMVESNAPIAHLSTSVCSNYETFQSCLRAFENDTVDGAVREIDTSGYILHEVSMDARSIPSQFSLPEQHGCYDELDPGVSRYKIHLS